MRSFEGDRSVDDLATELENILEVVKTLHVQQKYTGSNQQAVKSVKDQETPAQDLDVVDTDYVVAFESCEEEGPLLEWNAVGVSGEEEDLSSAESICSKNWHNPLNFSQCYTLDMAALELVRHERNEWAICSKTGYYVNGFYHTYNIEQGNRRHSGLITGVKCCAGDHVLTNNAAAPLPNSEDVCYEMQWWPYSLSIVQEGWFTCPRGMLLKGLLLSARKGVENESVIKSAKCCKSELGSEEYLNCYTVDSTSVGDTWVHACLSEGFQVAGMLRKNCNEYGEECAEEITCCMPA